MSIELPLFAKRILLSHNHLAELIIAEHRLKMSASESSHAQRLHDSIIFFHRYILPVLYLFGNLGNVLTALIFARKSWRKNVCVFYFNMSMLFNTFYMNSALLADILTGFDIQPYNSNRILCKVYYYLTALCSTFLPTVLILASIDRLLISSRNIDARLYSSRRLGYLTISLNTVFWFVFYIHIPIKADIQVVRPLNGFCFFEMSRWYLLLVSYSSLIIQCCFSLLMIILCLFTFQNIRHIRTVPRQQRHELRTMTKKDFQLLRCLFVHDIVYIIFTIGFSIYTVYKAATIHHTRQPLEQAIVEFIEHFNECLHHVPYCINFYIYIVISKAFRHALKRMIYKKLGKELPVIHEEEQPGKDHTELDAVVVNPIV